jgi:hypothetical protein
VVQLTFGLNDRGLRAAPSFVYRESADVLYERPKKGYIRKSALENFRRCLDYLLRRSMSDPEVTAFGSVIRLRNGGGGQRRVIAGSIREPKAILRNFHLELELQEKKKRIDRDKVVHIRNLDHRKLSLRTKMLERNARLHGAGLQNHAGVCRQDHGKHECPNMKLLWTLKDAHIHGRMADLKKATTPSCIHQTTIDVDDELADVRPRAISLESYFRQQEFQKQFKRRSRLTPINQIQGSNARSCPEIGSRDLVRGERLVLPNIQEHQPGFSRKGSMDSNIIERNLDSALSGRLSHSLDSLANNARPEPEPEQTDLPPRRLSRLRSVTIGQTVDIEELLERRRSQAGEEKVRRRSEEKMPNAEGLDQGIVNTSQAKDRRERSRRRSYESMTSRDQTYDSTVAEAERMLRKCRVNSRDISREHFDFYREVSKISNSFDQ